MRSHLYDDNRRQALFNRIKAIISTVIVLKLHLQKSNLQSVNWVFYKNLCNYSQPRALGALFFRLSYMVGIKYPQTHLKQILFKTILTIGFDRSSYFFKQGIIFMYSSYFQPRIIFLWLRFIVCEIVC